MRKRLITLSKVIGVIVIVLGLICTFGGFYFLSIGMTPVDTSAEDAQYRYRVLKTISAAAAYVMAFGVINCVAGFAAVVNSDTNEYNIKCRNYGFVMLAMCILAFLVLFIAGNSISGLVLIIMAVVTALMAVYLSVAMIRIKKNI